MLMKSDNNTLEKYVYIQISTLLVAKNECVIRHFYRMAKNLDKKYHLKRVDSQNEIFWNLINQCLRGLKNIFKVLKQ